MFLNIILYSQTYDSIDSLPEDNFPIIQEVEETELVFKLELHKSLQDSTMFYIYEYDTPYNCPDNLYFITKQYAEYFQMRLEELEKTKRKNQKPIKT